MSDGSKEQLQQRCRDRYTDDVPLGGAVGSVAPGGATRLGIDVEGRIGIDNGALRLRPLAQPGWGREGVAYGPFRPEPGLVFAAVVLNGHNASQTFYFPESKRQRIRRVMSDIRHRRPRRQHHYESLAVGFLDDPATTDPMKAGPCFVMHAATEDNGELWASHAGLPARIARGVQNLPILYLIANRAQGAAFYTASVPGATGAAPYPMLRPVGIDPRPVGSPIFAVIQQRILGEVGYRVDSRVYAVDVTRVESWGKWFGTAVVADHLRGAAEPLGDREPDAGVKWVSQGDLIRSPAGARVAPSGSQVTAHLEVDVPVGLVHAVVSRGKFTGSAEIRWRLSDEGSHLAVLLGPRGCSVVARTAAGSSEELTSTGDLRLDAGKSLHVEVLDDGTTVAVHIDGELVGNSWSHVPDWVSADAHHVGLALEGDVAVADLEAHPLQVPAPQELIDGSRWAPLPPAAGPTTFEERFDAHAPDLDGVATPSGGRTWTRVEGVGVIRLLGGHAEVEADKDHPFPDRAVFTIPWENPSYAHIELEMTIPGTQRGEKHNGRCGVVYWQDADNYLIINVFVDDVFDGASISTFYHLGGKEDMYDAVWTLVRGVEWGRRCTLWASFDGERFLSGVDGEPCLVRALRDVYPDTPPLRISAVGIIVNEEWGNDTGSVLHRFSAAEPAPAPINPPSQAG